MARSFSMKVECQRAARKGPWKIVTHGGEPWKLYNLAEDPTETTDVASANMEIVIELDQLFTQWKARTSL